MFLTVLATLHINHDTKSMMMIMFDPTQFFISPFFYSYYNYHHYLYLLLLFIIHSGFNFFFHTHTHNSIFNHDVENFPNQFW